MESWVLYSFVAFTGYFIVNLFLKFTSAENPLVVSLFLYGAAVLTMAVILAKRGNFVISPSSIVFAVIAGIASVTATVFALKALNIAPNPGYASTIYSANFFLIVLVSYIFFKAPFSFTKFLGVLATLVGLILISLG